MRISVDVDLDEGKGCSAHTYRHRMHLSDIQRTAEGLKATWQPVGTSCRRRECDWADDLIGIGSSLRCLDL